MHNLMCVLKKIAFSRGVTVKITSILMSRASQCRLMSDQKFDKLQQNEVENYSFSEPTVELYPKRWNGKLSADFVIQFLSSSLGCVNEVAKGIYSSYPQIREVHVPTFIECIKFLTSNGLSIDTIIQNFYLVFDPIAVIKQKIKWLSKLNLDQEEMLILMQFNVETCKQIVKSWEIEENVDGVTYYNRLEYFKAVLKCKCVDLVRVPRLLTANFEKLKYQSNLLIAQGFDTQEIVKNLHIFNFSAEKTEYRVMKSVFANIGPIDMRLLLTDNDKFELKISQWKDLGTELTRDSTLENYLMKKLQCSKEYIELLYQRRVGLRNIRVQQAKLVFDYITLLGFNGNDVCINPDILLMKVEIIKARHDEMTELGFKCKRLCVYMLRKCKYQKFVENLKQTQSKLVSHATDEQK